MKKLIVMALIISLAGITASCMGAQTEKVQIALKPGDKIGDMTLLISSHYPSEPLWTIWSLCLIEDLTEPGTQTMDCKIAEIPWIYFEIGWYAEATLLASNWDAMAWEMYIDDHEIDLDSFGWFERESVMHGENTRERIWLVTLTNPSPGEHSMRYLWTSKTAIDDGFNLYQPGTYEHVLNFTVVDQ